MSKKDKYFWIIFIVIFFLGIGFLVIFATNPFNWEWARKEKTETVSMADQSDQNVVLNEVEEVFKNILRKETSFKIEGYINRKSGRNYISGVAILDKPQEEFFADLQLNLQGDQISFISPLKIIRTGQNNFIEVGETAYFFDSNDKDLFDEEIKFKYSDNRNIFEISSAEIKDRISSIISKGNNIKVSGENNGRYKKYRLSISKEELSSCCSFNGQLFDRLITPSEEIKFVILTDKNLNPVRLSVSLADNSDYETYLELTSENLEKFRINKKNYTSENSERNLNYFTDVLNEFFSGKLKNEDWLLNTREGVKAVTRNWIKNKGTTYEQKEGSALTLVDEKKLEENHFLLEYQFVTQKAGFRRVDGDQKEEKIRTMELEVNDGVIKKAITDGEFDELEGERIK